MKSPAGPSGRSAWLAAAALMLFGLGFALADRFQLTHGVLYRAAANDPVSAGRNLLWLALQALALFAAIALVGRRMFAGIMVLAGASILVNLAYGQTLGDTVDPGKLAWLAAEARQGGNAAAEFTAPLVLAGLQGAAAVFLFIATRRALHKGGWVSSHRFAPALGLALLLLPSLAAVSPAAAERNVYSAAVALALAEPPPPREPVTLEPQSAGAPRHIVWLVDESVAHAAFADLIAPELAPFQPIDFGAAASLAHCSAPSNLALRSGVDVRRAGPRMDLRTTSSIWGYARKSGYRTILIDGQTTGAPQNLLLQPERALIDEVRSAAGGIDTDREIARALNRQLRTDGRTFTYAVLRGVHFQYRDHYPPGAIPAASPTRLHYETALTHSKGGFFEVLLAGVDRENVAIVYTSDHGQNLSEGALPHCSPQAVADEFLVPLLAFLPERLRAAYAQAPRAGHSASQIFPATLIWMGYDPAAVQRRYDNDLGAPTARYVQFDRNVVPLSPGEAIGIRVDAPFPVAQSAAARRTSSSRP
ncbi:sulfatase-like hydrolase/transferase [Altererythrobacter soli]|uniref:Sulfatase-like hydrolase/transferase n=1 Tax=Croceibacterium soli TaxID=1739690 RepID=A0A6I4UUL4_9SPHN|nr:sulfatase-like hydrolase/transferase [Croceibacterium soli]MXP42226.1 sulfatase-like hydrolase/transferase [Croceibacterium soli]